MHLLYQPNLFQFLILKLNYSCLILVNWLYVVQCLSVCVWLGVCSFVAGLRDHLQSLYSHSSSSANTSSSSSSSVSQMTHIHYRSHNYIVEYTPLMLAYIVLCLYLYFSVRKFTLIRTQLYSVTEGIYPYGANLYQKLPIFAIWGAVSRHFKTHNGEIWHEGSNLGFCPPCQIL